MCADPHFGMTKNSLFICYTLNSNNLVCCVQRIPIHIGLVSVRLFVTEISFSFFWLYFLLTYVCQLNFYVTNTFSVLQKQNKKTNGLPIYLFFFDRNFVKFKPIRVALRTIHEIKINYFLLNFLKQKKKLSFDGVNYFYIKPLKCSLSKIGFRTEFD